LIFTTISVLSGTSGLARLQKFHNRHFFIGGTVSELSVLGLTSGSWKNGVFSFVSNRVYKYLLTMEFAVDLGSVLRWGNQTVSCLWPVSKVKFNLEQATKAQRGNLGARCGCAVNATPRPLYPGKDPVPIVQEVGWAPGPFWTGAETLAPNGIRCPDRPARSVSLY